MAKFPPKRPDSSHIIKAASKHSWSPFQKDIFRNIARDDGHLIVDALAGSGKTTVIIESFKYIPKGKRTIALAFNKKIQEELQSRSPSYVITKTFHSLGFQAIKQRFGNVEIDDCKVKNLIKDQLGNDADYDLITNVADTVALCKYGLQDAPSKIDALIDNFGIDTCELEREQFISLVIRTLSLDKAQIDKIDFNDMCWFPFVYNLDMGKYHMVYTDEFQDLNLSQLVMAKKICDPNGGRLILTGDIYQSLYSWRLADTSIVDDIKKQPTTKILPLPISYRCPKKVIGLAQKWVPSITCPDTAIDGEIKEISLNQLYDTATPGCFILSRTNAPLIKICMGFIRRNIKANIRGRDIGKQLSYLVKKSKKKTIPAFLKWLDKWRDDELVKLKAKHINTDNLIDRHECLVNLADECKSLDEMIKRIDGLFNDTDEKNVIMLSTTHRAKGLETNDVFILRWTFRLWLDDDIEFLEKPNEECNIAYVAATRSKKRLFMVKILQ